MGKASKRRSTRSIDPSGVKAAPAPFVARPFEGLPCETEWVAMRELIPAATARITFAAGAAPAGAADTATVVTVLPLAWPALHRNDHEVLVATQSGASSGDASRDLAAALLLACAADEGTPVVTVSPPTADSPRLQDLLDLDAPFEVSVHEGFDFWVGDAELDDEGRESLQRANESSIPTSRVEGVPSAFWCEINGRTYVRWVLPHDEDAATDALARLLAADTSRLVDGSRLLGAFRASGLLVPVWEVPVDDEPGSFTDAVLAMKGRIEQALASDVALTPQERSARAGLVNRQVTLR
ncbi:MAG: DUF5926 family protein [Actinomycetota bacterium]|nr:DUF5926 family protein [Actinomycetota bacterium]